MSREDTQQVGSVGVYACSMSILPDVIFARLLMPRG